MNITKESEEQKACELKFLQQIRSKVDGKENKNLYDRLRDAKRQQYGQPSTSSEGPE